MEEFKLLTDASGFDDFTKTLVQDKINAKVLHLEGELSGGLDGNEGSVSTHAYSTPVKLNNSDNP